MRKEVSENLISIGHMQTQQVKQRNSASKLLDKFEKIDERIQLKF